ncbi:MAG: hypothetical protein JSS81_12865 [Acidobacteria bacterium]|nr:hypothetical protein [Acidobacteriota bacterium]
MKKTLLLLLLTLIFAAAAGAQADARWTGVYSYDEESLGMDWSWTSMWFRLAVEKPKKRLTGVFSEGYNSETTRRFRVTIRTRGDRAFVYYDRCLPPDERVRTECWNGTLRRGVLLFEFERATENGKPQLYTLWRALNLGLQTETGKSGKRIVFFRQY